MKILKIKDHQPPPGMEYSLSSYPGDGAYMTSQGLMLVASGMVFSVGFPYSYLVTDDGGSAAAQGGSGLATVDVHKLIDQISVICLRPNP